MTTIEDLKSEARQAFWDEYFSNDPEGAIGIVESDQPHDYISECADSSVPVWNADVMELGAEPEVYGHKNELPPAYDGSPTPYNCLVTAIYEIIEADLWEFWDVIKMKYEEILRDFGEINPGEIVRRMGEELVARWNL